ncbi:MAG TPA: hypothetical protein VME19_18040 [Streptosporangiaceae bacterium]|nr:hypothetical protein [Streptosporangiaceae bacterium]
MIRFPAMTPARRARVVGVLAVVPAAVFASGFFVASSLAAARHPAPVITLRPARPDPVTSPWRPICIPSYATGRAWPPGPVTRPCLAIPPVVPHFTVGGNLATPLYPGTSQRLDLTFTNPGLWPITIPAGGISARNITITSRAPGCASSNFAVTQGLARTVTIRARQLTLVSLSALSVPQDDWPVIEMIETNANQDACQGAKLTLTYSGIEAGR